MNWHWPLLLPAPYFLLFWQLSKKWHSSISGFVINTEVAFLAMRHRIEGHGVLRKMTGLTKLQSRSQTQRSAFGMISLAWNPRTGKLFCSDRKHVGLGREANCKGAWENFWVTKNVCYFDCIGGYIAECVSPNWTTVCLRGTPFIYAILSQ